jgi:NAD(P)-dependent dehydrogenase (short-subunit alcohol dehydrogenase family)
MDSLQGKVALLTGAGGGLGSEMARALGREGVQLVLSGRGEAALGRLAAELGESGVRCVTLPADLSDREQVGGLVARAEEALGPLDIVVNNAAVEVCSGFDRLGDADIERVIAVNLTAPLLLSRDATSRMLERGGGHIVFVSSLSGYAGTAFQTPYAATKGALITLSRSLRAEYIDSPMRFSVVSPGSVAGRGMFARGQAEGIRAPRALRLATPQAVARSVVETVRSDAPEALVYPGPIRPGLVLGLVAPRLAERLNERLGLGRMFRPVAEARGTLGSRCVVPARRGPGSQDQLLRS